MLDLKFCAKIKYRIFLVNLNFRPRMWNLNFRAKNTNLRIAIGVCILKNVSRIDFLRKT